MQHAEPRAPELEIRLLGPVEARLSERPLALDRLQQRALLALLALNANRVVSTDQLIDALWGERPPATASVALYGLVSGLRKLLEPDHAGAVVTKAPGYLLQLSPQQIDLGHFELLAAKGRRALDLDDPDAASALLTDALGLQKQDITVEGNQSFCVPGLEGTPLETCISVADAGVGVDGNPYANGATIDVLKGVSGGISITSRSYRPSSSPCNTAYNSAA